MAQEIGAQPRECNEWHQHVLPVISALHPTAVIAAEGPTGVTRTTSLEWAAGFKSLFSHATANAPSAIRIVLGTSPVFPTSVPDCLAAHRDPQTCSLHYTTGQTSYGELLAQDDLNASVAHAILMPSHNWFCTAGTCPAVIGPFVPYADIDHVTIAYSEFLSRLVTSAVLGPIARGP